MKTWEVKVSGYKTNTDTKRTELVLEVEAENFMQAYDAGVRKAHFASCDVLSCQPVRFANPLVSSC
jgi:hypothetical protein